MLAAPRWIGVALAAPLLFACRGDSRDGNRSRDRSDATFASRDTNRTLGPGDIRIMNRDSSFELAIIRDSIVTGFGPKTLAEIRKGTDTAKVSGDGMGASIEKFVKQKVASALDHEVRYAVTDVRDVRYEDDKLVFEWKDGSPMRLFESTKQNETPISATFSPADAQAFVAAFRARKAGGG